MSTIRVFVNASALDLPAGADVSQALRTFDRELESSVSSGAAYVTDGRGIEVDPATPLSSGAILRVVIRAQRGLGGHGGDADA